MFESAGNISPNLSQGTSFNNYQHKIKQMDVSGVEKTTGDNLGSIIEGLTQSNIDNTLNTHNDALDNLSNTLQIDPNTLTTSAEVESHTRDLQAARNNYNAKTQAVSNDSQTLINNVNSAIEEAERLTAGVNSENQKQDGYIQDFEINNVNADKLNSRLITISAEQSDSDMSVKSYGMQYLMYIIVLITMVAITFRAITASNESRVANTVLLLIALAVVFSLAKWLYNKIYNKLF